MIYHLNLNHLNYEKLNSLLFIMHKCIIYYLFSLENIFIHHRTNYLTLQHIFDYFKASIDKLGLSTMKCFLKKFILLLITFKLLLHILAKKN